MKPVTDNLRIASIRAVSAPAVVRAELPLSQAAAECTARTRAVQLGRRGLTAAANRS